jgi:hypothetical protein
VQVIGGTIPERLEKITDLFGLPAQMSIEDAISLAESDYAKLDQTSERGRVPAGSA